MDLKTWLDEERGRRTKLAEFLTTENPSRPIGIAVVSGWSATPGTGLHRPVPARLAPAIEKFTGGAVMRWDLCPTEWWELWPELKRRKDAPKVFRAAEQELAKA